MDKNQRSAFNMRCKFMGTKLLLTRFKTFNNNEIAFTRWLNPENILERATTGIRIYKPLWMDLLTAMTGKGLPNGNHDFVYIPFWMFFPKNKKYYLFKREGEVASSFHSWVS